MRRTPWILLVALFAAAPVLVAQEALPRDTTIKAGTLDNGLRYWIRHNTEPEDRLELRLIVRAGSILESDDQLGLAHFLEHMAFNGTARFPRNELITALESIGVRFGADLNASTGFDETTYILPVPSDRPELVELAFDILADWAGAITLDSVAVVAERGVVMGEWRSGLGAGSRVRDQEFPVLFQGSRYATRLPIGDTAIIAHAQPGPLREFYRDWYRPELMAVIAVGDYPVDELEQLISSRFGSLRNPANAPERTAYDVPQVSGTRVSIVTDTELTGESVQLLIRRPTSQYLTVGDERADLIESLLGTIVSQRLQRVARDAAAPFTSAFLGTTGLIPGVDVFALSVSAKSGQAAAAFERALEERRRFAVHGVLETELQRAAADLLRSRERAVREIEHTPSSVFVSRLSSAFSSGDSVVSAATQLELAQRFLPGITVADLNALAAEMAEGEDRFIALRAPADSGSALPDSAQLIAIMERTDTAQVSPWVEQSASGPLVAVIPKAGEVISESIDSVTGIHDWQLSNGIRVLIKPTDFRADEILMTAFRPGGTSLLNPAEAFQAEFGAAASSQSGIGRFDPPQLQQRLAGQVVRVSAGLNEQQESFTGSSSPADLRTFFELLWLTAMEPRFDSAAVTGFLARLQPTFANRDRAPTTAFSDSIIIVLGQNSPRRQPIDLARFESLEPALGYQLFRQRFEDFTGFTFVFAGAVDVDSLRPLVAEWIAALPTTDSTVATRDVSPPFIPDTSTTWVRRGQEPVSTQLVAFNGPAPSDMQTRQNVSLAASILQTRLLTQLRESLGATYGAQASAGISAVPREAYQSTIVFTSEPGQADSLWHAVEETIVDLQTEGPTDAELANAVEQATRSSEQIVRTNGYWVSAIAQRVREDMPLAEMMRWREVLDAVTVDDIRDAARLAFDLSRRARVILVPEAP